MNTRIKKQKSSFLSQINQFYSNLFICFSKNDQKRALFSSLFSRNPFQSQFYFYLHSIFYDQKILKQETHKPARLIMGAARVLIVLLKRILARDLKSRFAKQENLILIDSFVLNNSCEGGINNSIYKDRYYGNLLTQIKDHKNVYLLPSFIGFKNYSKAYSSARNCQNVKIIVADDYLNIKDFILAFLNHISFYFLKPIKKVPLFKKTDVSKAVYDELQKHLFITDSFQGWLNKYFIKNFCKIHNNSVSLFVDWNENQIIDKGYNQGLFEYSKHTIRLGYRGGILAPNYGPHMFPLDYELKNHLFPDKIFLISSIFLRQFRKYSGKCMSYTAPAYRYLYLLNRKKQIRRKKHFLLLLPIEQNDAIDLYKKVAINKKVISKCIFKFHPSWGYALIKKFFALNKIKNYKIESKPLKNILDFYKLFITNASTAALEIAASGAKVLILQDNVEIDKSPIPDKLNLPNIVKLKCLQRSDFKKIKSFLTKRNCPKTFSKIFCNDSNDKLFQTIKMHLKKD